jgi:hypothetical protein
MTIKINLSDKLVLTSDKNQFILNQRSIASEGKTDKEGNVIHRAGDEILSPFACYGDLGSCLRRVPQQAIMQSDAESLDYMIAELKKYELLIKQAIGD